MNWVMRRSIHVVFMLVVLCRNHKLNKHSRWFLYTIKTKKDILTQTR